MYRTIRTRAYVGIDSRFKKRSGLVRYTLSPVKEKGALSLTSPLLLKKAKKIKQKVLEESGEKRWGTLPLLGSLPSQQTNAFKIITKNQNRGEIIQYNKET